MPLDVGERGELQISGRTYEVRVIGETITRTTFWVACIANPARSWKPAEVRVNERSEYLCFVCRKRPSEPCLHITLTQRFVASQAAVQRTRGAYARSAARRRSGSSTDHTISVRPPTPIRDVISTDATSCSGRRGICTPR